MVAVRQLQLLTKPIPSYQPHPTPTLSSGFQEAGLIGHQERQNPPPLGPSAVAASAWLLSLYNLSPHPFPAQSGPTPSPGLTDADLSQDFWKTPGLFVRLSHPMAHSGVTLFLIPNFLASDLIPHPL